MFPPKDEVFGVLRQFNPWWGGPLRVSVPGWRRAAFRELYDWVKQPPMPRSVLVAGPRQIGKTTLLLQAVEQLLKDGAPASDILYVTFDHPLLKLAGLEATLNLWREVQPATGGTEYLFLDEVQMTPSWGTWIKHQVDFQKNRRIVATGSAVPLRAENVESGVGRWHTIKLPTLSFREYLQLRGTPIEAAPTARSLRDVAGWGEAEKQRASAAAKELQPHFHEYLLRGGFPQTALHGDVPAAQRALREDIVDKVLKRDMTAMFGVRRVLELERAFLYLCLHDGGIVDVVALSRALEVSKHSVNNFIDLFEAAHLLYKLRPYGYGKEVLRGKYKCYLADAAIAGAIMLKGWGLIEDSSRLGAAVETAFFKHVYTHYYQVSVGFSYWRGAKDHEVDIVAEVGGRVIPFEVKYTSAKPGPGTLRGLRELCEQKRPEVAYVITRDPAHLDRIQLTEATTAVLVPAPLACLWL